MPGNFSGVKKVGMNTDLLYAESAVDRQAFFKIAESRPADILDGAGIRNIPGVVAHRHGETKFF